MQFDIERIIRTALIEDIGLGDVTTEVTVPIDASVRAELVAKEDFTLAGLDVAAEVFRLLDPDVKVERSSYSVIARRAGCTEFAAADVRYSQFDSSIRLCSARDWGNYR